MLWSTGHESAALGTFDRAIDAARARNPHSLNNRGALLLERGEHGQALPDFHRALLLDPSYETARRNRDAALSELGEPMPLQPVDEEPTAGRPAGARLIDGQPDS